MVSVKVGHYKIRDRKLINFPPGFFFRITQGHWIRVRTINHDLTSRSLNERAAAKSLRGKCVACSNHEQLHFQMITGSCGAFGLRMQLWLVIFNPFEIMFGVILS